MKTLLHILAIITFTTSSCAPPCPPPQTLVLSPERKAAISKEVTQMLLDYHKSVHQNGLTAEFDYLDNSPEFFWAPPGFKAAIPYDSVRRIIEQNALAIRSIDFHWDSLAVFPLSPEIASYTGIVSGEMTDTSGQKTKVTILESGTVILRKNGWKMLNGQSVGI